ncbi:biotin-dependent carboxyltransferase family protein [Paramicrobacterium chengjingii]|uniref:Biotin-dependent carboxyltransferase family protein n=1 Tax=Paramicrobacterium chengjingii TaxID=2769067 RepID=A0ABX6YHT4_9MICO|nr:biotin-dependent carboxyltransferase family protein [Microbacterium chengjingii]QPZ38170.1 biotin-dependent carboxyltransferase family protein [Microbacterium chengjingii]
MSTTIHVTSAGWMTTFQDLGRRDAERLGVPTGGAADQHSAAVANILVGNGYGDTLIESIGGELALVPEGNILVAVTGAPVDVTVNGARVEPWSPVVVPRSQELRIRETGGGMRTYLAINGHVHSERFLGSTAPDPRMGFTQKIGVGESLFVDTSFAGFKRDYFDQPLFRLPSPTLDFPANSWTIDIVEGRALEQIPSMRELLSESTYVVTDRSNHVGLRLDGPVAHPESDDEIVSHGVPIGALEVPHADELIVLGRYRTLTAGYPIVGFATRASLALLGQAGPGRHLRFRWVDHEAAVRKETQRRLSLDGLRFAVREAFDALGFSQP